MDPESLAIAKGPGPAGEPPFCCQSPGRGVGGKNRGLWVQAAVTFQLWKRGAIGYLPSECRLLSASLREETTIAPEHLPPPLIPASHRRGVVTCSHRSRLYSCTSHTQRSVRGDPAVLASHRVYEGDGLPPLVRLYFSWKKWPPHFLHLRSCVHHHLLSPECSQRAVTRISHFAPQPRMPSPCPAVPRGDSCPSVDCRFHFPGALRGLALVLSLGRPCVSSEGQLTWE